MTTDARTYWYQKHDLLACAARHGFAVTESRFDEWVERPTNCATSCDQ